MNEKRRIEADESINWELRMKPHRPSVDRLFDKEDEHRLTRVRIIVAVGWTLGATSEKYLERCLRDADGDSNDQPLVQSRTFKVSAAKQRPPHKPKQGRALLLAGKPRWQRSAAFGRERSYKRGWVVAGVAKRQ